METDSVLKIDIFLSNQKKKSEFVSNAVIPSLATVQKYFSVYLLQSTKVSAVSIEISETVNKIIFGNNLTG